MLTIEQLHEWQGQKVRDREGQEIGDLGSVYRDRRTGEADWVTVQTGLFGRKVSFVPARGAEQAEDGLRLQWDKATVKDAPRVDDDGELTEDEERELYAHYGMEWGDFDYDDDYQGSRTDDRQSDADSRTRLDELPDQGDVPLTHDEDDPIRDPEQGDRRNAKEMVRPEVIQGVRPEDSDEIDSAAEKLEANVGEGGGPGRARLQREPD
jgi:hypothetical protein